MTTPLHQLLWETCVTYAHTVEAIPVTHEAHRQRIIDDAMASLERHLNPVLDERDTLKREIELVKAQNAVLTETCANLNEAMADWRQSLLDSQECP